MAMSLSNFLLPISILASIAHCATVTYDFDIAWTYANPDGQQTRPIMGVNGKWPLPSIIATKGDQVVVNVKNSLGNESTSLHFHGLYQNGTTHMDGPVGVSQCGILPGSSFTYNFTVRISMFVMFALTLPTSLAVLGVLCRSERSAKDALGKADSVGPNAAGSCSSSMRNLEADQEQVDQPGTYWYHSHERGQYPDGLRAPFVVHDPEDPHKDLYDEEIVLSFSDWYHERMQVLLKSFVSVSNPSGAEPVPQAALMNDTQNVTVKIQPGKTYLFRMINMGAFAAQYVWFEGHTMKVVEVDGVYTEPMDADMLYMTAAQRYSVLVTAKNETSSNFAIMGSMDQVKVASQ
jgi:FtsP/CotA-like multicopper oxidase with cupredoxin domain